MLMRSARRPADPAQRRPMPTWPLWLVASPAAVAVWSGWVALGSMCGFGYVDLLPGIAHIRLDTAITLPVGVEAYGAYALGAWLRPGTPELARKFAKKSALGALGLGMGGQVIYHLLAAAHQDQAPWPVVIVVACLPVVTLGFAATLTHLLTPDADTQDAATAPPEAASDTASQTATAPPTARQMAPRMRRRNRPARPPHWRRRRPPADRQDGPIPAASAPPDGGQDGGPGDGPDGDRQPPRRRRVRPSRLSPRAKALQMLRADRGLTDDEVMKETGASKRTVERARQDLAAELVAAVEPAGTAASG
jgi:hypothetical protein